MRVVVHIERFELADLIHVLEAADFKVTVIPSDLSSDDGSDDAEIEIATHRESLPVLQPDRLMVGDLMIDLEAHVVQAGGTRIDLTSREFDLLCALVRNPNRVLSKDALVDLLWSHEPVTPNAVEARISSLRRKLGRRDDDLIQTVRGVGYVFRTTAVPDEVRRELLVHQRRELVRQRDEAVARREAAIRRREARPPDAPT